MMLRIVIIVAIAVAHLGTFANGAINYERGNKNTLCDFGNKIVSATQCRSAAIALGSEDYLNYVTLDDLTENNKFFPGGCYEYDGTTWFNTHSGTKQSDSRPICLKKTTPT